MSDDHADRQLLPEDLEGLFRAWSNAYTCPRWRLGGGSPSPGLVSELASSAAVQHMVRDPEGKATALLQVVEVKRRAGFGYLSFIVCRGETATTAAPPIARFLHDALARLDLVKICVVVDEDMAEPLAEARACLVEVGRLRLNTRVGADRYVDRMVFEFLAHTSCTTTSS